MAGQLAAFGKRLGTFRPTPTQWAAAFVLLGLVYLIVGRISYAISRWPATIQEAVAPSHCDQFVALAKATYGNDWKARLDPRDTTCADEVQQEWQRQWIPREVPAPEPTATSTPVQSLVAPVTATRAPVAETYCLNVISLAKAKYGPDWTTKIDPADGKACESQIASVTR